MPNLDKHGLGGGKYRKNSMIPFWLLSPMMTSKFSDQLSSHSDNGYRPVIKYDKTSDSIWLGAGRLIKHTKDFKYVGELVVGASTISEIIIHMGKVYMTHGGNILKTDTVFTSYSQISRQIKPGLAPVGGFLYCYSDDTKTVYGYDSSIIGLTGETTVVLSETAALTHFQRDENNFYLTTTTGEIRVYDLTGTLVNTFVIASGVTFNQFRLFGDFLYLVAGKTLRKVNKTTGQVVWMMTMPTSDGSMSQIEVEDKYVYVACSSTSDNFFVVNNATGDIEHNALMTKPSYPTTANKGLYGVHVVDNVVHLTHYIHSDSYGYYFHCQSLPVKQKILR